MPTVLTDRSGSPVEFSEEPSFDVSDDGLPVKSFGEKAPGQPVAIVVVMQTGGSVRTLFQNYEHLATLLTMALGSTPHDLSLVSFDSHPHKTATFPLHFDYLEHAMTHPDAGDRGAAILDAVSAGLDMFDREPANYRRVVLLLSQQSDIGSMVASQTIIQKIAESGATVYSFTFPGSRKTPSNKTAKLADQILSGETIARSRIGLSPAEAIRVESSALRTESGHALAVLSGGEAFDIEDLESGFAYLRKAFIETYMLSFTPASSTAGLHLIEVHLRNAEPGLRVRARLFYWKASSEESLSP